MSNTFHAPLDIWTSNPQGSSTCGWPTPLKNDGVRQLGWWHSQYDGKVIKLHGSSHHQPEKVVNWSCYLFISQASHPCFGVGSCPFLQSEVLLISVVSYLSSLKLTSNVNGEIKLIPYVFGLIQVNPQNASTVPRISWRLKQQVPPFRWNHRSPMHPQFANVRPPNVMWTLVTRFAPVTSSLFAYHKP